MFETSARALVYRPLDGARAPDFSTTCTIAGCRRILAGRDRARMADGGVFRLSCCGKAPRNGLVAAFRRGRERSGSRSEAVQTKSARIGGNTWTFERQEGPSCVPR